jgi:hypothetical protein
MECPAIEPFGIPSATSPAKSMPKRGVSRFSILCGFVTADLYWLYLTFLSHVINPVSVFVVDSQTGRHLQSGAIGSLAMTVAWSEVRRAVLLSLIVFMLATLVVNVCSEMLASSGSPALGRLAPATTGAA